MFWGKVIKEKGYKNKVIQSQTLVLERTSISSPFWHVFIYFLQVLYFLFLKISLFKLFVMIDAGCRSC